MEVGSAVYWANKLGSNIVWYNLLLLTLGSNEVGIVIVTSLKVSGTSRENLFTTAVSSPVNVLRYVTPYI